MKILAVDDDPSILEVLEAALSSLDGYDVYTALSASEALEILMDHPAVAQAVTFAMPHDKLGEDVAAAIVFKDGASATEAEVRSFARKHLADMKVPRTIIFLDEIPKGATGKLQRIGLAEKLGLV